LLRVKLINWLPACHAVLSFIHICYDKLVCGQPATEGKKFVQLFSSCVFIK